MATVRRHPTALLLDVGEILSQLRETPSSIKALTADLSAQDLHRRPMPDEWSINDNLAHLRASADVWGRYMGRILAEDHPAFTSINPRAHMRKTDYPDQEFAPSLQAFAAQRAGLLATLDELVPDDWARTATVKVYGELWEHGVQYYGDKLARHEAVHLPQIEGVVRSLGG
jgi:hypothetical protein